MGGSMVTAADCAVAHIDEPGGIAEAVGILRLRKWFAVREPLTSLRMTNLLRMTTCGLATDNWLLAAAFHAMLRKTSTFEIFC